MLNILLPSTTAKQNSGLPDIRAVLTAARSGQGSRGLRTLDGEDRCGITVHRQAAADPVYCSRRSRILTPNSARALQLWRTVGANFAPAVC